MKRQTRIIATLGPTTARESVLRRFKDKGVDFVRVNMSHSSLADLEKAIALSKKVGIPFIIDTEGSQVRTGELDEERIDFPENAEVRIHAEPVRGDQSRLHLRPPSILQQLEAGDLIHIDFDTLVLRVSDVSKLDEGVVVTRAITGGSVGRNKAVVVDPVLNKKFELPPLSPKDHESLRIGLREGIGHIALSFARSAQSIDTVRKRTHGRMKIIAKIECVESLENIDEIIEAADALLIDRGDLSKEIPLERIPFTQKILIEKARLRGKDVFVATNLLESMVENRKPTRAEVHDVIHTVTDGAAGLTLASETAIGKYPLECVNMLNRLIQHAESVASELGPHKSLVASNYLLDHASSTSLVPAHGGRLVQRILAESVDRSDLKALPRLQIDDERCMDVEQIAIGTYSPLQGFMGPDDFEAVLDRMRLANGTVWPIPVVLDVSRETATALDLGQDVVLVDSSGREMAVLHVGSKYTFDPERFCRSVYSSTDSSHPGVQAVGQMRPVLLGGTIDLIQRRNSAVKEYELSPRQVRRMFEERGWATILGFHTRNVIHRAHEFIQLHALERENCDGLFIHPVVGKKKPGDFYPRYIVKSYERMISDFYPSNRVVMATFSTSSRYAGPREALFTALCRKNFGCSHFIVGRDHTGVGRFYSPEASQRIFDEFPDLGIKAVKFDEVYFSKNLKRYVHRGAAAKRAEGDKLAISGTDARELFQQGRRPPEWFMRPEISQIILDAIHDGEDVFVDT